MLVGKGKSVGLLIGFKVIEYNSKVILWLFICHLFRMKSYGNCLEVKREYYQSCSMLDCVTQCSQSAAVQHTYMSSSYRSNRLDLSHCDPTLCIEAVA